MAALAGDISAVCGWNVPAYAKLHRLELLGAVVVTCGAEPDFPVPVAVALVVDVAGPMGGEVKLLFPRLLMFNFVRCSLLVASEATD